MTNCKLNIEIVIELCFLDKTSFDRSAKLRHLLNINRKSILKVELSN